MHPNHQLALRCQSLRSWEREWRIHHTIRPFVCLCYHPSDRISKIVSKLHLTQISFRIPTIISWDLVCKDRFSSINQDHFYITHSLSFFVSQGTLKNLGALPGAFSWITLFQSWICFSITMGSLMDPKHSCWPVCMRACTVGKIKFSCWLGLNICEMWEWRSLKKISYNQPLQMWDVITGCIVRRRRMQRQTVGTEDISCMKFRGIWTEVYLPLPTLLDVMGSAILITLRVGRCSMGRFLSTYSMKNGGRLQLGSLSAKQKNNLGSEPKYLVPTITHPHGNRELLSGSSSAWIGCSSTPFSLSGPLESSWSAVWTVLFDALNVVLESKPVGCRIPRSLATFGFRGPAPLISW